MQLLSRGMHYHHSSSWSCFTTKHYVVTSGVVSTECVASLAQDGLILLQDRRKAAKSRSPGEAITIKMRVKWFIFVCIFTTEVTCG